MIRQLMMDPDSKKQQMNDPEGKEGDTKAPKSIKDIRNVIRQLATAQ